MLPFVPDISGVKVPISTFITLWLYFLFFSFSCSLKIVAVYFPWLDRELTCVTRTSKNAVTPGVQKPPAFISSLASRLGLKVEYFIVEWLQEWLSLHISAHFTAVMSEDLGLYNVSEHRPAIQFNCSGHS